MYDGPAIGDDVSPETPFCAQLVLQQELICTRRLTIDGVVSAHDGSGFAFRDSRAKCRLIRVELIVFAYIHVCKMTRRLRTAVHVKVLRRGDYAVIFWVVPLHAGNKSDSIRPLRNGSSP